MARSKSLGAAPSVEDGSNSKKSSELKADNDIASLTKGLGNVSINAKPSRNVDAPGAIQNVADLISSNKYKNIVVLTGAGISCNAGIPGERMIFLFDEVIMYQLYMEIFDASNFEHIT